MFTVLEEESDMWSVLTYCTFKIQLKSHLVISLCKNNVSIVFGALLSQSVVGGGAAGKGRVNKLSL